MFPDSPKKNTTSKKNKIYSHSLSLSLYQEAAAVTLRSPSFALFARQSEIIVPRPNSYLRDCTRYLPAYPLDRCNLKSGFNY